MAESYRIESIGQVQADGDGKRLVLRPEVRDGLLGIEGFSHLWVLYWFHENDHPSGRSVLRVRPRKDPSNPLTGVFGTRSPLRPNLVALALCEIREVRAEQGEIRVFGLDARPGSPLVDLKPFLPHTDVAPDPQVPAWARRRAGRPDRGS